MLQASSIVNIADAALATALSMGSLAFVTYKAPTESFLGWGTFLSCIFVQLASMSMLVIARPGSQALRNVWMFGGLALSAGLTMVHMQGLLQKAKLEPEFDPLGSCIGIYLDTILFFVYFLQVLAEVAAEGGDKK